MSNVIAAPPCPVPEPVLTRQVHPSSSIQPRTEHITQSHLDSVSSCEREKVPEQPQTAQSFPQPSLGKQVYSTPSSSPSPQPAESLEGDGYQGREGKQTNSTGESKQGKNNTVPFPQKKKSYRYTSDFYMITISYDNMSWWIQNDNKTDPHCHVTFKIKLLYVL